jgi:hypothetical protein
MEGQTNNSNNKDIAKNGILFPVLSTIIGNILLHYLYPYLDDIPNDVIGFISGIIEFLSDPQNISAIVSNTPFQFLSYTMCFCILLYIFVYLPPYLKQKRYMGNFSPRKRSFLRAFIYRHIRPIIEDILKESDKQQ